MIESRRRGLGFTLVEVLVALALSAMVAVLAYQSLAAASDASRAVKDTTEQMDRLDRAWQFIQRDLGHVINRAPLSGQDQSLAAFEAVGDSDLDSLNFAGEFWFLRLTRRGWQNPLAQTRSELQGVAYRLEEGVLYRVSWPVRDEHDDLQNAMQRRQLLTDVETLTLRFLPPSAQQLDEELWVEQWPLSTASGSNNNLPNVSLPQAVEISLITKSLPETRRVFLLAGSKL